jgi:hypothetical protein
MTSNSPTLTNSTPTTPSSITTPDSTQASTPHSNPRSRATSLPSAHFHIQQPRITATTMSSNQRTPDMMPPVGSKSAPEKFKGSAEDVKKFLKRFNQLCSAYNVTPTEKCERVLDYCSGKVTRLIEALPSYNTPNWNQLEIDILSYYDADLKETRFMVCDLHSLTRQWKEKQIKNLTVWKKYQREFVTIAGWLKKKLLITDDQEAAFFWKGMNKSLRRTIENRLMARNPLADVTKVFPITDIINTTKSMFERNRFDHNLAEFRSELPDWNSDSEDSDSDSDSESSLTDSDEDSDEEEIRHKRSQKKKKLRKTRSRYQPDSDEEDSDDEDEVRPRYFRKKKKGKRDHDYVKEKSSKKTKEKSSRTDKIAEKKESQGKAK